MKVADSFSPWYLLGILSRAVSVAGAGACLCNRLLNTGLVPALRCSCYNLQSAQNTGYCRYLSIAVPDSNTSLDNRYTDQMGDIWSPNPIKSEIWWLDTSSSPSLCFGNHDWCCAFNHNHDENVQLTENCKPGTGQWCWAQRPGGNYRDINIQGESGDWGWLGRGCIAADSR